MSKYGVVASKGGIVADFTDWAVDLKRDEAQYVADRLKDDGFKARVVNNYEEEGPASSSSSS